jgi:hypothetical protein
VISALAVLVLSRAFVSVKTLFSGFFWKVPMPAVVIASGFLIILGAAAGLMKNRRKRGIRQKVTVIAIALGLFGLTGAGIGSFITDETPFKRIVITRAGLDDGKPENQPVVLRKNMPGIWIRIDGIPLDDTPGNLSFEMLRHSPGAVRGESLSINGLKRDIDVENSRYYFPKQGIFMVPGPFQAGDKLTFQTINESGFDETGKISFELWEAPQVFAENIPEFEGTIGFYPKEGAKSESVADEGAKSESVADEGAKSKSIADYEGKITLIPRETVEGK